MENFDLEIIIPVTNSGKYAKRLEDFKKIGILNVKDRKVLLTLLVGTENPKNFSEGWPANITVKTVSSELDYHACKTYNYFAGLTKEYVDHVEWFMKIDDDSCNDIDVLLDSLNDFYDRDSEVYAVTHVMEDLHDVEFNLIKEIGQEHIFINGAVHVPHEHEGCVLSKKAMLKIVSNAYCMELFEKRSKIPKGHTDQCLGCAARIVKINLVKSPFMASLGRHGVGMFTLFGGFLAHLHPVSREETPEIFKSILSRKNADFNGPLSNQSFFIIRKGDGIGFHHIVLLENGNILGRKTCPEKFWFLEDNKLNFLSYNGNIIVSFDCEDLHSKHFALGVRGPEAENAKYMLYGELQ